MGGAECAPPSFERDVRFSRFIVAGTVVRSEYLDAPGGGVMTRYVLADLVYAKGSGPADSLALGAWGGIRGGEQYYNPDEDYFDVGQRYVVLAVGSYLGPSPLAHSLICGAGPYQEYRDSVSGRYIVHAGPGRPFVHVDSTHAVVTFDHPWSPEQDDTPPQEKKRDPFGQPVPTLPPAAPLADLIRKSDIRRGYVRADGQADGGSASRRIRWVMIWPHQDPGTRVDENEFLGWLRMIVHRVMADSTLAK